MPTEVEYPPEQSATSLVSGILGDLQHLVEQQFQLTRREIEEELRQRAAAAAVFGLGMVVLFLGSIVLCLTLAHGLHWAASPSATDPARLPLWACYAVVAAVLAAIGGILACVGRARFKSIEPFQNPITEILQELVPWPSHPK
jgi:hypothetical protein